MYRRKQIGEERWKLFEFFFSLTLQSEKKRIYVVYSYVDDDFNLILISNVFVTV